MDADAAQIGTDQERLNAITHIVLGCAFKVVNELGNGFVEKVYENALVHELRKTSVRVQQQAPIQVFYDGHVVGEFVADLIVENAVLVELKVARGIDDAHRAQCLNYLKATGFKICLLLNFGLPRLQYRRLVNKF